MLATRIILVRPIPHLQRLYSSLPDLQQWPQYLQQPLREGVNELANDVENMPSTHRGAAATSSTITPSPREIFDSWNLYAFYSPKDFLRSRRLRASAFYRTTPPSIGPGAKEAAYEDAFRHLDINPVEEANNRLLLGAFMTGMGKIRPRAITGLSWRSQRKVGQAIKRAKQKGVLPMLSNSRYIVP